MLGREVLSNADAATANRAPQTRVEVVRTLRLSTRHLPTVLLSRLDEIVPGNRAQRIRHGYLLAVPSRTVVEATAHEMHDTVTTVWLYALAHNCRAVVFEHAGPVMADLRIYHD